MGKQVRFFNYPADVAGFDAFLADSQAFIVRGTAATATPVEVRTLRSDCETTAELLLVRSGDLSDLRWRHLPSRGLWTVDKDSSPVIEYIPGYNRQGQPRFVSSHLGHGRLWFQTSHWAGDQLVRADPDFVAWSGRLFGWIKKHWVLIESDYYSPAAADLWNATWQVVFDEPYEGARGDQLARWRRQNDPNNELADGSVHTAISRATRDRPRRLTIAVRASGR